MIDIWDEYRNTRPSRYLPTPRTDKRRTVRILGYAPNYAHLSFCVSSHEFKATRCILQPFLTYWLLHNLTWCTLHPHILGFAAVKMQYWRYFYKYFALISSTDVKCTEHDTGLHITCHYIDVIMTTMTSQITSLTVVYSTVYSDADQWKHQSSASLAFVWGIHRDRWIPRTNGQLRGKCFHLMTSSCTNALLN